MAVVNNHVQVVKELVPETPPHVVAKALDKSTRMNLTDVSLELLENWPEKLGQKVETVSAQPSEQAWVSMVTHDQRQVFKAAIKRFPLKNQKLKTKLLKLAVEYYRK